MFVDPLDGTREFVEGRLGAVQTLIGVSVRGCAVAGAIGVPFFGGSGPAATDETDPDPAAEEERVHVVYGLVGAGTGGVPAASGERPPGPGVIAALSPGSGGGAVGQGVRQVGPCHPPLSHLQPPSRTPVLGVRAFLRGVTRDSGI